MTIQTDITRQDWDAFVKYLVRQVQQTNRGRKFLWVMLVAGGSAAVVAVLLRAFGWWLHLPSFVAGVMTISLAVFAIARIGMYRLGPEPGGIVLGPRHVTLEQAGIRQTSELHDSLFHWAVVRGVCVTASHVFVMVDANAAIIIPLRHLRSDVERDQLLDEIRKRAPA